MRNFYEPKLWTLSFLNPVSECLQDLWFIFYPNLKFGKFGKNRLFLRGAHKKKRHNFKLGQKLNQRSQRHSETGFRKLRVHIFVSQKFRINKILFCAFLEPKRYWTKNMRFCNGGRFLPFWVQKCSKKKFLSTEIERGDPGLSKTGLRMSLRPLDRFLRQIEFW